MSALSGTSGSALNIFLACIEDAHVFFLRSIGLYSKFEVIGIQAITGGLPSQRWRPISREEEALAKE